MTDYDIICVGGGISGLYSCNKLQKNQNVLLLEKSNHLGGRIKTNYTTVNKIKISYEEGGARFSQYHTKLLNLLKEYKLSELYKINKIDTYLSTDNSKSLTFREILDKLLKDSKKISTKTLKATTVYNLCKKLYGSKIASNLTDRFHYYSEIHIMNAYDALETFKKDLDETKQFFILGGGLSKLINKMKESFIKLGGKIKLECYLDSIHLNKDKTYTLKCIDKNNNVILFDTKKIILTIGQTGLKKIKYVNNKISKLLNTVDESPLHRIYAMYPKNKDGKVWFHNLKTTVTNLPLKFIIPINADSGLIMITYTDGKMADYWLKLIIEGKAKDEIKYNLKQLFPDLEIPEPIYFKNHYWKNGATYWKKNVNSNEISKKMIKPIDNEEIYICGDNYSSRQAWMEGALDTAYEVVKRIGNKKGGRNIKSNKRSKKNGAKKSNTLKKIKKKVFSMDEVKKHNTKNDAWLIINKKIYDVSEWIDRHPGGPIILQGIGKDATEMFNNTNHSSGAKNRLKGFYIGDLE